MVQRGGQHGWLEESYPGQELPSCDASCRNFQFLLYSKFTQPSIISYVSSVTQGRPGLYSSRPMPSRSREMARVYIAKPSPLHTHKLTSSAGILEQSMGARNRVGKGLSYRPARLHRLASRYDNSFPSPIYC